MKITIVLLSLFVLMLGYPSTSLAQVETTEEHKQAIEDDPEYARLYKRAMDPALADDNDDFALLKHVGQKYGKATKFYLYYLRSSISGLRYEGGGAELTRRLQEVVPLMETVYGGNSAILMTWRKSLADDLARSGFPDKAVEVYFVLLDQKVKYTLLNCDRADGKDQPSYLKEGSPIVAPVKKYFWESAPTFGCKADLTFAKPLKETFLTLFAANRDAEVNPTYRRVRNALESRWRECDGPRWKFNCARVHIFKAAIDGAYADYLFETDRKDQAIALYETIFGNWLNALEKCPTNQTCKIMNDVNSWKGFDAALGSVKRDNERLALAERVIPAAYAGKLWYANAIAKKYLELSLAADQRERAEAFISQYDISDSIKDIKDDIKHQIEIADAASRLLELRAQTNELVEEARISNLRAIAAAASETIIGKWSSGYVYARLDIGRYYLQLGQPESAANEFRRLGDDYMAEAAYDSVEVAVLAAQYHAHALVQSGKPRQAAKVLHQILIHPFNPSLGDELDFEMRGTDPILDYSPFPYAKAQLARLLLTQNIQLSDAVAGAKFSADYLSIYRDFIGFDPVDHDSYTSTLSEQPLSFDSTPSERFLLLVEANWRLRQSKAKPDASMAEEAFAAAQDAMLGTTTLAIAKTAAELLAKKEGLGDLLTEQKALQEKIQDFRRGEGAEDEYLDESARSREDRLSAKNRAYFRKEEITLELKAQAPDYFALIRPEPLTLPAAQSMLGTDEAALLLVPTEFGTHVMAVTKDGEGLKWHRSDLKAEDIEMAVAKLRLGLDQQINPLSMDYDKPFDRSAAYALYKALIEPVADRLKGKTHVYVEAAGSLTSLPLSVLVTAPPEGDDDDPETLRNTPWLSDQYALVQIPSLQSLQLLRNLQSKKAANDNEAMRPFDGFGDPLLAPVKKAAAGGNSTGFDDLFVRGARSAEGTGVVDLASLKALPSLPGTATELKNLRKSLDAPESSIRMQAAATEAAVKDADLSSSRILAFATHGVLAGEITGAAEPSLVFTPPETASEKDDGLLTASEITTLNLNADWVILSACNTASGDGKGAPGLSGLARSFFYAGARNLLASHWPVRDDVASTITVDTIDQQKSASLSRAQAFQKAMQNIRNDSTDNTKAHPAAWAPFVLVGDK